MSEFIVFTFTGHGTITLRYSPTSDKNMWICERLDRTTAIFYFGDIKDYHECMLNDNAAFIKALEFLDIKSTDNFHEAVYDLLDNWEGIELDEEPTKWADWKDFFTSKSFIYPPAYEINWKDESIIDTVNNISLKDLPVEPGSVRGNWQSLGNFYGFYRQKTTAKKNPV